MMDDGALRAALADCARGDRAALKRIFEAEAPRLIGVAARIVRRRELAEEVVQDAFVQIWTKADQYVPERGSARGWVHAIVRNRALNLVRDTGREAPTEDPIIETLLERDALAVVEEAEARLTPGDRLKGCLEALDEMKRRSVLMVHVLGYTHGEIAGRLGVPLGTAKAWVRRGLNALRECLS